MSANEYINLIKQKTLQLEAAMEATSIYSEAVAVTTVHDICQAAIQCLPDNVSISPEFFNSLKEILPARPLSNYRPPEAPKGHLVDIEGI